MKDTFIIFAVVLGLVAIFAFGIFMVVYKYKDCKKVGHTIFYCLMQK